MFNTIQVTNQQPMLRPTTNPKDIHWLYDSLNVANKRNRKFGFYKHEYFYAYLDSIQQVQQGWDYGTP